MMERANIHAERMLIGAMLHKPEIIPLVTAEVGPEHLFFAETRSIMRVLKRMHSLDMPIDADLVLDMAEQCGEKIDTEVFSVILDESCGLSSMWRGYASLILREYEQRKKIETVTDAASKVASGEKDVGYVIQRISQLGESKKYQYADAHRTLDVIEKCNAGSLEMYRFSGLDELDKYPPGKNELVIVGARPSVGKTSLAVALGERYHQRGARVLMCSLEMAADDITIRRIAAMTRIPQTRIRAKGALSTEDFASIGKALDYIHRSRDSFVVVHGRMALADITGLISRHKPEVVIIDHLGLMILPEADRQDLRLGEATATLASIGKKENIMIMALHQLNRATETRENRRPSLSDLRDSGRIEQDADCVWLLYRESYYDDQAGDGLDVIVAKNRNGRIGVAKLHLSVETGEVS